MSSIPPSSQVLSLVEYYQYMSFAEPVGSVAPKVEIKDKAGIFLAKADNSLALLCPAQSYPMPAYR